MTSETCYLCWKEISGERWAIYRHAVHHLADAVKDCLAAVDMMEDYQDVREKEDLVLYAFNAQVRRVNSEFLDLIAYIREKWDVDEIPGVKPRKS